MVDRVDSLKNETLEILTNGAKCVGIDPPKNGVHHLYRKFILDIANESKSSIAKSVHRYLHLLIFFIPFLTLIIDKVFSSGGVSNKISVFIWTVLTILWIAIYLADTYFPQDAAKIIVEADRIRTLALSERFAAQLALYTRTRSFVKDKDVQLIYKISDFTKNAFSTDILDNLGEKKPLIDQEQHNENVDDSRIIFDSDIFDKSISDNLSKVLVGVNDACASIFMGSNFTTKIYLTTENDITLGETTTKLKLLTSFAKSSPNIGDNKYRGSSWLNCQGQRAVVWECLETGKHVVKKDLTGLYQKYPAILFICLPGKIGVLSIGADNPDAFDEMVSKEAEDALAIATRDLTLKAIGINE